MTRSDEDSIFGHTYQGVPNPQIPFKHAYPTRYHGPIFTEPRFGLTFQSNPYALAPYSGADDDREVDASVSVKGILIAATVAGIGYLALQKFSRPKRK